MFKGVFGKSLDLLKKFIIAVLELDESLEDKSIILHNSELFKSNKKEYQKNVDIYAVLNNNIHVDIEMNRSSYESVKERNYAYISQMYNSLLESGMSPKELKKITLYQLNLNAREKAGKYGTEIVKPFNLTIGETHIKNVIITLKNLDCYRYLYYTKGDRIEGVVWLTALTAQSYEELYDILKNILSKEELNKIMKEVGFMLSEDFSIHDWNKEFFDELVRLNEREAGKKEGISQGISQGIRQTAKNLLKLDMKLTDIKKATGLSIEELTQLQKEIN